jgi:hypothetical protein
MGGQECLFYKSFPIDVGIIRATTGDPDGDLTMEKEALTLEALAIAMAAHNSGGHRAVRIAEIQHLDEDLDVVVPFEPQRERAQGLFTPGDQNEVVPPLCQPGRQGDPKPARGSCDNRVRTHRTAPLDQSAADPSSLPASRLRDRMNQRTPCASTGEFFNKIGAMRTSEHRQGVRPACVQTRESSQDRPASRLLAHLGLRSSFQPNFSQSDSNQS